jgi:hypothetical protein
VSPIAGISWDVHPHFSSGQQTPYPSKAIPSIPYFGMKLPNSLKIDENPNMLMVDQFPYGNGPLFRETRFQTQWEFQDPKMKVLYHKGHILLGYSLT